MQIILSLYSWCSDNVYQERLPGILLRTFLEVLSGNSVEISIIDSFSPSVINGQITEGSYLSIMYLLIGNRLKIFYWNNFWYLPIDK
ncbi:hypothetical protein C9Z37_25400 [Escherichia coli]|nr:hypothetical protein C9Z37_25400 [Escherichia coli]